MPSHKKATKVETGTTYCGDHYCDGHKYWQVVCECGKELYNGQYPPEDLLEKHRVAVALGEE